jgi:hypothetical protein
MDNVDNILAVALGADVSAAAVAATNAALNEATRQADLLTGGRPVPGSQRWEDERAGPEGAQRELAAQIVEFRIALKVGIDPLGNVVGLRRWGATWELIAKAAGISRQAAHERWGRAVRRVLDPYGTGELGGPVADDEVDLVRP